MRAKQLWQVTKQVHRVIRKLFPRCKAKFSLHLFLTLPNAVMWFDKSVNRDQLSNIERSVNFVTSQENDRQFYDICLKTVYAKKTGAETITKTEVYRLKLKQKGI